MTPGTISYVVYLAIMATVTLGVGRRLHRHGAPFLEDVYSSDITLASHTNNLLLVGFYLTNFALVLLLLRHCEQVHDWLDAIHFVSSRVGLVLVILGLMHFFNVAVLTGIRCFFLRRSTDSMPR